MARARTTDVVTLWRNIVQAGGIQTYIEQQLQQHGFVVERRDTANMSKKELDRYKKQLKEEAAQRKKLKTEAWKAYKSQHIVHLGEHVYWNDDQKEDDWDVPQAEARAAENDLPPLDSPKQLADALELTIGQLRWLCYHRDAATSLHYRSFTIPKRNGTPRTIWAPMPKLKKAQRWILANIVEKLLVHGAAHGFLSGRSIVTNAAEHTQSKLVLKMDMKDFFPTVTFARVKGVFRKAGYRELISTLLALICTEAPREVVRHNNRDYYIALGPRCLPQGAPTSPGLTNALCLRLDRRLTGLAQKYGWRYTRYADDLTFSLPVDHKGPPNMGKLMGLTKRTVHDEGFTVHPDKTRVARVGSRQKVTGLVVNGDASPRVPRKIRRQVRAAIHNLSQGKPLKEGETTNTLIGYAAYIHMTDPKLGSSMLDALSVTEKAE